MATTLRLNPALQARLDAALGRLLVKPSKASLLNSLITTGLADLERQLDAGGLATTAPAELKPAKPRRGRR